MRTTLAFLLALSATAPVFASAPDAEPVTVEVTDHTEAWRDYLTARRVDALQHLAQYAEARVYPINDFQRGAASQLRDAAGNPCAMASLVEHTGHTALIDTLAATHNDLRFEQLTPGHDLHEWTLTSGLLLDEAAMVQEPDFYIGDELGMMQEPMVQSENERLYQHFSTTTQMLAMQTPIAIDAAVAALGDRVLSPPPTTTM